MRWPRIWVRCSFIGLTSLLPAAPAQGQVITVLHSFTGGTSDGSGPGGSLLLSGTQLFGMTDGGGSAGDGTIFQLGTNGNGYAVAHSFAGLPNDGSNPHGSLIQSGLEFYGMTSGGGSANQGTVFKVGANGTGYTLQHQFGGGANDGTGPLGSLIQSGTNFYGMTSLGGSANQGTVFKIGTDGTGFNLLHSFTNSPADGRLPSYSSLVASGSALYGMTVGGGSADFGTVFKINADGTGFNLLHSFNAATGDGWQPYGSLTLSGSTLYGMTRQGGGGAGTIFDINTDGTGYAIMHTFAGSPGDGANPVGDLIVSGSSLFGTTPNGGADALGTLFGVHTDGTGYSVFYSFTGSPSDGANPGDVLLSDSILYGVTGAGGSNNLGTVFSFTPVPEPSSFLMVAAGGTVAFFVRRRQKNRCRVASR